MKKYYALLLFTVFAVSACKKNDYQIVQVGDDEYDNTFDIDIYLNLSNYSYQCDIPNYLKAVGMPVPEFDNAKVALGRVLFYDKNLSADRSISCASCHQQKYAFSDNAAQSRGIKNQLSARNSMPLGNTTNFAAHYSEIDGRIPLLLWDHRAEDVAQQAPLAITNSREMGMSLPEVAGRIREKEYYGVLWNAAFHDFSVSDTQILEALSEFVGAIRSTNSIFDKALIASSGALSVTDTVVSQLYYGLGDTTITTGLPFFTESAFRGLSIFVNNCSKCHSPIRPFQEEFIACNGLEMDYPDQGLGAITHRAADNGVFKSPPLRNIALTAPYMHDGRFQTLREVVDFYDNGVVDHPNLHPLLRDADGKVKRLHLSNSRKNDLIAFLHTLTDNTIQTDIRFSNPFQ